MRASLLSLPVVVSACAASQTQPTWAPPPRSQPAVIASESDLEMTVVQGVYGTVGGSASLGYLVGGAGAFGGAVLGGATAVGLASLDRKPSLARTQVFDAALPWLAWHGLALNASPATEKAGEVVLVASPVVAPLLAWWVTSHTAPSSGQVAVANSLAIWTPVAVALARGMVPTRTGATPRDRFDAAGMYALLAATDIGLVAGSLLGREFRFNRSQVLAWDGCALGGLAIGALGGALVANDEGGGARGAVLGLVAGAALCIWAVPPARLDDLDKR